MWNGNYLFLEKYFCPGGINGCSFENLKFWKDANLKILMAKKNYDEKKIDFYVKYTEILVEYSVIRSFDVKNSIYLLPIHITYVPKIYLADAQIVMWGKQIIIPFGLVFNSKYFRQVFLLGSYNVISITS